MGICGRVVGFVATVKLADDDDDDEDFFLFKLSFSLSLPIIPRSPPLLLPASPAAFSEPPPPESCSSTFDAVWSTLSLITSAAFCTDAETTPASSDCCCFCSCFVMFVKCARARGKWSCIFLYLMLFFLYTSETKRRYFGCWGKDFKFFFFFFAEALYKRDIWAKFCRHAGRPAGHFFFRLFSKTILLFGDNTTFESSIVFEKVVLLL